MVKAACWICKKFASNKDLVIPGGADCFPNSLRSILAAMFPDDCEDLPKPHQTHTKARSIVVIKNDTKLKWFAMTFQSVCIRPERLLSSAPAIMFFIGQLNYFCRARYFMLGPHGLHTYNGIAYIYQ